MVRESILVHFQTWVRVLTWPKRVHASSSRCLHFTKSDLVHHTPLECLQIQCLRWVVIFSPAACMVFQAMELKVLSDHPLFLHQYDRIECNDHASCNCVCRFLKKPVHLVVQSPKNHLAESRTVTQDHCVDVE